MGIPASWQECPFLPPAGMHSCRSAGVDCGGRNGQSCRSSFLSGIAARPGVAFSCPQTTPALAGGAPPAPCPHLFCFSLACRGAPLAPWQEPFSVRVNGVRVIELCATGILTCLFVFKKLLNRSLLQDIESQRDQASENLEEQVRVQRAALNEEHQQELRDVEERAIKEVEHAVQELERERVRIMERERDIENDRAQEIERIETRQGQEEATAMAK